jgi:diguanylate cyclase (GGDEF)-like protein
MKNLFSIQEQQSIFQQGKELFLDRHLQEAENLFSLVMESALQYKDYSTYIAALIWRNRTYVNMTKFLKLNSSLSLAPAYLHYLEDEELYYLHRFHIIICNHYFSVGNNDVDYEQLFNELLQTKYDELTFLVGSNYLLHLIETNELVKSTQLCQVIDTFLESYTVPRKISLAIHQIYVFLVHFKNNDLAACSIVLNRLKREKVLLEDQHYSYCFYVCEALYIGATGNIPAAKKILDEQINKLDQLVTIHFELKLWIALLLENKLFEYAIYYQQLLLQSLETLYTNEMSTLRQKLIEDKTKHYYESQIYIDQLTGVKNRNYYENLLTKQAQVKNYTLAVLDIDKFKHINDTYGHSTGDDAIRWVAKHLIDHLPKQDISIVRYGGDEFILLIPHPYETIAPALKDMHASILQTAFTVKKTASSIPISISIGVAYTNEQYTTLEHLFELADSAIYKAKENRGTIVIKKFPIA